MFISITHTYLLIITYNCAEGVVLCCQERRGCHPLTLCSGLGPLKNMELALIKHLILLFNEIDDLKQLDVSERRRFVIDIVVNEW